MRKIDLHVHSNASDGTLSPSEVVDRAVEQGLCAFALTDHDTLQGIDEARKRAARHRARGSAIEVYPGVEISAAFRDGDIHILGLLLDTENDELLRTLQEAAENRRTRNEKMIARFAEQGITLTMEELTAGAEHTVVTRGHFARLLVQKGIVATPAEAFARYLDRTAPCYVPRGYLEPEEAIRLIRGANGVPVLAHPLLYGLSAEELFSLVDRLTRAGLEGLEVFYSSNRGADEDSMRSLAAQFSLCMTGGSDFHGAVKPNIELGSGKGNLAIPYAVLERLMERKKAMYGR